MSASDVQPEPVASAAQFRPADSAQIDPAAWAQRARSVRDDFVADGLGADAAADALRELRLVDAGGAEWTHDGAGWRTWAPPGSTPSEPAGPLRLQPFSMPFVAAPDESPDDPGAYVPTDLVPDDGMPAWTEPDPAQPPVAMLEAGLDVMLLDVFDDGWALVRCSNDWVAWVDGNLLVPLDD